MEGSAPRWDLLLRNALLFDGSGNAPRHADVAIAGGRIAEVAAQLPVADAAQCIDVQGRWLMPGLLDVHTHFDLEVEIEPQLPEAVRHGTTTVVVANCSLGLAYGAQRRNGEDPIVDCFARVENVPKSVLRKVADRVDWNDSADYLAHFDRLPLGPNVAPMIPHSMLRIEVMGLQASVERDPTEAELARMEALVDKGMREGYVGFSTDGLPFHFLANAPNTQKQIPTQFAPFSELKRLTGVVRRWGRVWQATPPKDDKLAVFRNFLLTSGRLYGKPLKVTAVAAIDVTTNRLLLKLGLLLSRMLNSKLLRGVFRMQALAAPFKIWSDGVVTPIAEEVPVLRRLNECDLDDRARRERIMADPVWVAEFRRMWRHGKHGFGFARLKRSLRLDDNVLTRELRDMTIEQCPVAEWSGETMQAVYERLLRWQASGEGACGVAETEAFASFPRPAGDDADFFLHLLRRFDTTLRWWTVTANRDPGKTKALLFNPLLLPGFNDSGAHLTNMAFYDGNLRMLKLAQDDGLEWVAQAVRRLTREPAEFFGLDVGTVEPGAVADLVMIDPEALRHFDPDQCIEYVYRDAFEHHQLVNRPQGVVAMVLIGGRVAWRDNAYTACFGHDRMGRVLRHRDHALSGETLAAAV
ncbi:N-acyl-D-glutamate deacylase [Sinimarinibacterium sp. CAU 1509]|uniref:N-acyl-D-amino-acid deacylase family protein n=1 Tax=Sinimarinibacterium sp. CAU 1509 TaxID=2562283 RepID=UPI0010AC0F36|nr:amidohydrolase family protein [Sinimarinibacterium sp. CAU 1509]TJY63091.1 N-acyl-D-glutamate deacylase [Sinimarinibacterium sp. CAU 1509]